MARTKKPKLSSKRNNGKAKRTSKDRGNIPPDVRAEIICREGRFINDRPTELCAVCNHVRGKKKPDHPVMEVHHIVERSRGGAGDDVGNLICLCRSCHNGKIHYEYDLETIRDVYVYMNNIGYDYKAEQEAIECRIKKKSKKD